MTEAWHQHGRHDRARVPEQQVDGRTVWLTQQEDGSWLVEGAGGNAVHLSREVMFIVAEAVLRQDEQQRGGSAGGFCDDRRS